MNIIWNGALLDPSGYGNCARQYVKALNKKHDVRTQPVVYFTGDRNSYISREDKNFITKLLVKGSDYDYIYVEHKTPGALNKYKHKKDIGYTVWETDRVPERFLSNINSKDEIWTPSLFSKNVLESSGTTVPIKVIPHIIDTEMFKPDKKDLETTVFLFNGEFTFRKGIDILFKAYLKAFTSKDKVELLVKTNILNNLGYGDKYISESIDNLKKSIRSSDYPKISVSTKLFPDSILPRIYNKADVFVTATRGEGFGLPIAEAMSCGLVTIVPDKGGHTDFCDKSNSVLVRSKIVPIDDEMLEPGREVYKGQRWIETHEDSFIETFREVHNNLHKYKEKTENAVNKIREHCSAERIVKLMEDTV